MSVGLIVRSSAWGRAIKRFSLVLYIFLLATVCMLTGCKGETVFFSSIPSYPVYLEYDVLAEDPHFVVTNTGAYKTFTEKRYERDAIGFAGIVIFVGFDAQYYAFDMGCPVCLRRKQPVEIDGMFASCPVCGEKYDLSYGFATPSKGISNEALRRYDVVFDGRKLVVR